MAGEFFPLTDAYENVMIHCPGGGGGSEGGGAGGRGEGVRGREVAQSPTDEGKGGERGTDGWRGEGECNNVGALMLVEIMYRPW